MSLEHGLVSDVASEHGLSEPLSGDEDQVFALADQLTGQGAIEHAAVDLGGPVPRLDDLDLWVVMIDGIGFADHMALVALGISQDGRKHVLGIREGSTENATVARALLRDLLNRGLPDDHPVLFVIDGGQGIRKAIKESFGELAAVQRCQFHKIRNVAGHLPAELRDRITGAMKEAYHLKKMPSWQSVASSNWRGL